MRLSERLQYVFGIALYILYFFEQKEAEIALTGLELLLIIIGFIYEGTRFHQLPFILGFIIQSITLAIVQPHVAMTTVNLALLILSITFCFIFGEANLNRIPILGPYQVGYKEFRTSKFKNMAAVYYPIDKEHYKNRIGSSNPQWLRHGKNTLMGIAKAAVGYGQDDKHIPLFVFKHLLHVKLNASQDSDVAPGFLQRPMIPIIYCHGLGSTGTMHSGTCRDLASHGYIVFIIDHKDGTSLYYEDEEGKGFLYENKRLAYDLEFRKSLVKIRENEVEELINELFDQERLLQDKLKFPKGVKMDLDKLVVGGHSFGGITAIATAKNDSRIKACITLDPWLFVYHKEILSGDFRLNFPFISVSTQMFHPYCDNYFPSLDSLNKLVETSQDSRKDNIFVKNTGHLHQCDLAAIIPFELFVSSAIWPQTTTNETYVMMSQLLLSFLGRIGFNNSFEQSQVDQFISSMTNKWLKYETRFDDISGKYNPPKIKQQ